ncbi:N-acetylmuramoyl-L-alanine amidase [Bifidobacterium miconisargentati]|uniref:peptidoglycan recognition protein family protein n=1 Tax=Bifidobacterium miconisargentati TaxID=2834437 RepID=UPI001F3B5E68|nr:peptidoglycan recognition family protein [Bifidobacterium miconisargentati]
MQDWNTLATDETMLLNTHYTPGRAGRTVDKIVLHHNAGNLSIPDCWNVWQTRAASAHYQVDANGRIGRLVNDTDTAWHSGDWDANLTSIGIEHADVSTSPWLISQATLDNGAHLVAALCHHYGLGRPEWLVNVYPHNHFQATACPASIADTQRDEYMRRAQEYYDQIQGEDNMPTAQEIANAVWNFDQNGVLMRDRVQGTDTAANKTLAIAQRNDGRLARMLMSLKRYTGIPDDDTTTVPDLNNSMTGDRVRRITLMLKRLCGIPDDDTTLPDTITLSDTQLDAIADRVATRLKGNA